VTAPVDSEPRPHDGPVEPATKHRGSLLVAVGIGVVLVAAIVLRFVASSALWLDEALSVNVARLPLGDLHAALKRDGAPPLYYVLLHFWTDWFGTSDTAVRGLSGVLSVATFPAMYFIGKRVGGRFTAWAAVLLYATLPYSIRYGSETRMYALVMFLVAWGYLAFVRAVEKPTVGRLALVSLVVAGLLYSQNWALYLMAVVGLLVIWLAWRGGTAEVRHAARRVIVAMIVGGIL
jgi:mannosyltransferase